MVEEHGMSFSSIADAVMGPADDNEFAIQPTALLADAGEGEGDGVSTVTESTAVSPWWLLSTAKPRPVRPVTKPTDATVAPDAEQPRGGGRRPEGPSVLLAMAGLASLSESNPPRVALPSRTEDPDYPTVLPEVADTFVATVTAVADVPCVPPAPPAIAAQPGDTGARAWTRSDDDILPAPRKGRWRRLRR